jgi:hypothetical protein
MANQITNILVHYKLIFVGGRSEQPPVNTKQDYVDKLLPASKTYALSSSAFMYKIFFASLLYKN